MTRIRKIGVEEARKQFAALLETVHHGKTTVITRHDSPYAAIAPALG